ncbi:MAG: hypothetical protein ACF8R7_17030, partial [Phycisphaerales bacterium JB039]
MTRARWLPAALAGAIASTACGQARFIPLPEGIAGDVSADGAVVVGGNNGRDRFAYRWEGGVSMSLGLLPGAVPGNSRAFGVSSDGRIVVGRSTNAQQEAQAFRWEGEMAALPYLSMDSTGSEATAVSGDARITVGLDRVGAVTRAVRWLDGVPEQLPDLPGGVDEARADDVSRDGRLVVGVGYSDRGEEAVLWRDGVPEPLGALSSTEFESGAVAIAPGGGVIVGYSTNESGRREAFRWEAGAMEPLGMIEGSSTAQALSADGSLIGGVSTSGGAGVAFIWDRLHGIRDLNDVLQNEYGLDLQGVLLTEVEAISDDGLTLVGGGFNPAGRAVGWIAVIPAPSGLLVISGGLAAA